jgi:hypothetical protein
MESWKMEVGQNISRIFYNFIYRKYEPTILGLFHLQERRLEQMFDCCSHNGQAGLWPTMKVRIVSNVVPF